jgi:SAM-dependent methyltransferase
MANFPPFKTYILSTLDEFIRCYQLTGPFIDIGCGRGDVAEHLARRGWSGKAIDISSDVVRVAQAALQSFPSVQVSHESLESQTGDLFSTAVMFDILEHIPDDRAALAAVATIQPSGAALVSTVPSNPDSEWRWDDDLYGHIRRYRPEDLTRLLLSSGYQVIEMWDISFPIFWILRRGFTALKRSTTLSDSSWERTEHSALTNAWDLGFLSKTLSYTPMWEPVYALQRRFRHRPGCGNEVMVLARRV